MDLIDWSDFQVGKILSLASATFGHGHVKPNFWRKHNDFTGSRLGEEISLFGSYLSWCMFGLLQCAVPVFSGLI